MARSNVARRGNIPDHTATVARGRVPLLASPGPTATMPGDDIPAAARVPWLRNRTITEGSSASGFTSAEEEVEDVSTIQSSPIRESEGSVREMVVPQVSVVRSMHDPPPGPLGCGQPLTAQSLWSA